MLVVQSYNFSYTLWCAYVYIYYALYNITKIIFTVHLSQVSADSTVNCITKNILIFTVHLSKVKLVALLNEKCCFFFKKLYFNVILSFFMWSTVVCQPTSIALINRPRHFFKSNCDGCVWVSEEATCSTCWYVWCTC